jgi:hypothetical protein
MAGQVMTFDIKEIPRDARGAHRLVNMTLKSNSFKSQSTKEEKKDQVIHTMAFDVRAAQPLSSHAGARSLAEELGDWLPPEQRLLPPIFKTDFTQAREEAAGNADALALIDKVEAAQALRHARFVQGRKFKAVSAHISGAKKLNYGPASAPVPSPTFLLTINRSSVGWLPSLKAFDAPFIVPDPCYVDEAKAHANIMVAVTVAPASGQYVHTSEDKPPGLMAKYSLLVDQTPPSPVSSTDLAKDAPAYAREYLAVGIGGNKNAIFSELFTTLHLPAPFLADVVLRCPTPAFEGVPLHLLVRSDPEVSLHNVFENTSRAPDHVAARRDLYPNGMHAGTVVHLAPLMVPWVRRYWIPVSHALILAHFWEFVPGAMYGEKTEQEWKLGAFHKQKPTELSDNYWDTSPKRHDGYWWLTTYTPTGLAKISKIFGVGPKGEEVAPWDTYLLPAYAITDAADVPSFDPTPHVNLENNDMAPRRIGIRDTAAGDAWVKKQLVKQYLGRPANDETVDKNMIEFLKQNGDVKELWKDPQLWLQAKKEGADYTMPLFIAVALPRRPTAVVEAEEEGMQPPPPKKMNLGSEEAK